MNRLLAFLFFSVVMAGCTQQAVTPMQIASQINVVTASQGQNAAMSAGVRALKRAFNGAGTDYTNDPTNFNVHIDALGPLDQANIVLCYLSQLGASDPTTLNAGNYLALVDPTKCERGINGQPMNGQSSSNVTVQRRRIVVNNSRADNSSPQILRIWTLGERNEEIRGEVTILAGAAEAPPFGIFTFNWIQVADDPSNPTSKNSLKVFNKDPDDGSTLVGGNVGLTLYSEAIRYFDNQGKNNVTPYDVFGPSARLVSAASAVMETDVAGNVIEGRALTQLKVLNTDTRAEIDVDAVLASLHVSPDSFPVDQVSNTYAVSYNAEDLLVQSAHMYSGLPYVQDPNNSGQGTCLSRHEYDESIWCYNLYDAQSGARVELNSSFPFSLQKEACGPKTMFGNLGYYGAWFEGDQLGLEGCKLETGDVVSKKNFDGTSTEHFALTRTTGHLVKNTVLKMPLLGLRGVELDLGQLPNSGLFADPQNNGPDPYAVLETMKQSNNFQIDQWVVHYLTAQSDGVDVDGFYIYGFKSNSNGGPTITSLADVQGVQGLQAYYDVTPRNADGQQIWFYSQQLGGGVIYTKDQNFVVYNTQEIVDPSDDIVRGTDRPVQLRCLFGCLKSGITNEDQSTQNGPMVSEEAYITVSNTLRYVPYEITREELGLKNLNGEDIALAPAASSVGMYNWGISMSPLVTTEQMLALTNWWDIWNTEGAVFYRWETGSNSWNVTMLAQNTADGNYVTFDKPIQISYTHTTDTDREHSSTYNGQTYLLNYGGVCQFWGIPSAQVGSRYFPLFGIADGTVLGDSNQYVVKAIQGEQRPSQVNGECTALSVADPAVGIPATAAGVPSNYETAMPVVEAATVDNGVIVGK